MLAKVIIKIIKKKKQAMDIIILLLAIVIFILAAYCIGLFIKVANLQTQKNTLQQQLVDTTTENNLLNAEAKSALAAQAKAIAEKEALDKNMLVNFENLATKLLEQTATKLKTDSNNTLQNTINPLQKDLENFKTIIDTVYTKENNQRVSLETHIKSLMEQTNNIKSEAANLTNALVGNKKIQGNWGEITLDNLLKESGLIENIDYTTQSHHKDDEINKRRYIDVLINMPENKKMAIDSKVSLVNYFNYINSNNATDKKYYLDAFIQDIKNQIAGLSSKEYFSLVNSIDLVIMYMPLESSYNVLFQEYSQIQSIAYEKKVLICNSASLLATLKSVHYIRKLEKQNTNAATIAKAGADLYDKFVLFIREFDNLGVILKKSQDSFNAIENHMNIGRANLIKRVEYLKRLGVSPKKDLSDYILDNNESLELEQAEEANLTTAELLNNNTDSKD